MAKTSTIKALISALLLISPAAYAAPVVLDFEGFGNGQVIDDEYSALGVTISAINNDNGINGGSGYDAGSGKPDLAVIFDSSLNPTKDGDLEDDFNSNNPSLPDGYKPGNLLIIQENDIGCSGANPVACTFPDDEGTRFSNQPTGTITFEFTQLIELLSIDFFDVESAENGTSNPKNKIRLFDGGGTQIGLSNTPDTGNNLWDQVVFGPGSGVGVSGVRKIEVNFAGSGALDNVTYNVVPVPASVWLFGSALIGFIGYSRRRIV